MVVTFVHLHVYSAYSLLNSTISIKKLIADAKAKGYKAIALTDRNVMYGTVSFYQECLQHGMKPLIGLTVDVLSEFQESKAFPLVLLAKNQTGLEQLLKISSAVQTKSPQGIPVKWLRHYAKGLYAISPGMEGEIEQGLLQDDSDLAQKVLALYKQIFEANSFFLGIQDHGLNEERKLNPQLIKLAQENSVEIVATNGVHYLHSEDAFAHECLLAIKNGNKLNDPDREKLPNDQFYLKTPQEMTEIFSQFPDALENTLKIAENCNVMIELQKTKLPKYPTEKGMTAEELLERLCWRGFKERYPDQSDEKKKRLMYELSIIKKMKFSDYFLIVWDFMRYAREAGILTGPGRGSAAGSMVAYTLYITDVDPIKYELLFERFLNPERISMPDIDLDFPDHRRDEVIQYVCRKYGQLHAAQIITFGTFAAKAVLRDVGRVFGLNTRELEQLSRMVPGTLGITLKEAYRQSKALQHFVHESDKQRLLFETALRLEGLPRHTSIHAAGVVLSQEPLVEVVPITKGHNEMYLTQYSMEYLEELGLLKMDFLGLRNLTLLESITASIYRTTGQQINVKEIPLNDPKTYQLLSTGQTTGVFQLESEGMRSVLKRLQPNHFEDIVAVNALYRPGPMENIPHFIERKHGREPVVYPHPDLQPILEKTYGVIVYQEQIMQIASKMAGFTLGEADILRRAVSKKQKEILDRERVHFVAGAERKGYARNTANHIYDLIVRFANYGFNRSHAVAYSFISYQLAWLKAHYPLCFMAALLTSAIGNEKKTAQYIQELKQMNIPLLPPSINHSGYSFFVDKGAVRYSLAAIKGVGAAALKEIFRARKEKTFSDLFDFCLRVSSKAVNRHTLEALVHSGSFDEFGEDRAVLLASLDAALDHAQLVRPAGVEQGDLFAKDALLLQPKYTVVDPIPIAEKLRFEKEVLGFYLSDHPVSLYREYFPLLQVKPLYAFTQADPVGRAVVYISAVKKIRTRKGEQMAFLTLSDQSGDMEAVIFPNVLRKIAAVVAEGNILLLEMKFEQRQGKAQLIVQNGESMNTIMNHMNSNK